MNNSDFAELGLGKDTLRSVAEAGYTEPTPIQKEAIPFVLMGRDLLGCAQTGTGKTAGFTLPMLDILSSGSAKARMPRALVLEPTRELATQVAEAFEVYGKYHELSTTLLIGGVSIDKQEQALERNQDVLIATPGRLLDLFERGRVLLSGVKMLVIDEADRMLDIGFIPDVERIVRLLPKIRQTLFFSATIPGEVRRLADSFLMNPKEIYVDPSATAAVTVDHGLAIVDERDKREALRRLIRSEDVKNALIFCNRKRDVDVLYRSLKRHAFDVKRPARRYGASCTDRNPSGLLWTTRSDYWWQVTWPRAASTLLAYHMSSISMCRIIQRTTFTGSVGPGGPGVGVAR